MAEKLYYNFFAGLTCSLFQAHTVLQQITQTISYDKLSQNRNLSMNEFQALATTIMLSILALLILPKIFTRKTPDEHLSAEEKAMLYPQVSDAEFSQTMPFDVVNAINAKQKIQAIKLYKQQFGCSLKDAKNAVERYMIQHK